MKTCRKCGEEFDEGDNEHDPVTELGDMFSETMGEAAVDDLCPKCRERSGIVTLLAFDL